jgi:transposase
LNLRLHAAEYEIHLVQVSEWKKHLMDNMDSAFEKDTKNKKDKVGQLTMEVEWLQKKCVQLGLDIDDR